MAIWNKQLPARRLSAKSLNNSFAVAKEREAQSTVLCFRNSNAWSESGWSMSVGSFISSDTAQDARRKRRIYKTKFFNQIIILFKRTEKTGDMVSCKPV